LCLPVIYPPVEKDKSKINAIVILMDQNLNFTIQLNLKTISKKQFYYNLRQPKPVGSPVPG
jgi:hypothetical protein